MDFIVHEALESRLEESLSPDRRRHSMAVARYADSLARRFGASQPRCTLAGLAHDLAREWDAVRLREVAARDGNSFDELERANPILLHGRAAAVMLSEEYGVTDREVLEAVRHHTLGHPDLGQIGSILFCADYLAPNRGQVEPDFRRRCDGIQRLEELVVVIIDHASEHFRKIAPITLEMYRRLSDRMA